MNWHIGTAGWYYKDWEGSIYPKGKKAGSDYLEYYAQLFSVVEVNATYYSYLNPNYALSWVKKTADNQEFVFTIKLHQDFTHKRHYSSQNVKSVRSLFDNLSGEGKLGGVLIQFPFSFVKNHDNARYVNDLDALFNEYRLFYEFRHKSWFCELPLLLTSGRQINVCSIDQPVIGEALPFNVQTVIRDGYVRLHGRNKPAWEESIKKFSQNLQMKDPNARYHYYYSPSEMQEIRLKIEKKAENATGDVFVIFNNHPFGYAPANALELKILLESLKPEIPMHIALNFPRLAGLIK